MARQNEASAGHARIPCLRAPSPIQLAVKDGSREVHEDSSAWALATYTDSDGAPGSGLQHDLAPLLWAFGERNHEEINFCVALSNRWKLSLEN